MPLSQLEAFYGGKRLAMTADGNLFGRMALHPSVSEISDQSERGRVVNAAWRRYGVIQSLSLAAVIGGWAGARLDEAADRRLTPEERRLARAKDVLVGVVGVTGVATAAQGLAFSRKAPNGAVPLSDGERPAPQASEDAKRAKRRVNALGLANLVSELALVSVNAALEQRQHRRPAVRRLVPFVGRT